MTGESAASGFGLRAVKATEDRPVATWITETLFDQLHRQYGWKEAEARAYAAEFLSGRRAAGTLDRLERMYPIADLDVIEVGSGLGSVLLELRRRGIRAKGVEPSGEWCGIIRRRLREEGLPEDCIVEGVGERLPFESASADLVVSMQVLEHVDDPERVMAEIDRVLRPGGKVYISAPNYMAFFEDHYRVPWFPGLSHRTGGWYLRAIGRDPEFYRKHVNNLTYLQVARAAKRLGWIDLKLRRHADASTVASLLLEKFPGPSRALYHVSKFLRAKMNLHFEKPVARSTGDE